MPAKALHNDQIGAPPLTACLLEILNNVQSNPCQQQSDHQLYPIGQGCCKNNRPCFSLTKAC